MNKRETALEVIRIEYAKNGCSTIIAMRAYVENRISIEAYQKAIRKGIEQYNEGHKKENEEKVKQRFLRL